MKVNALILAAGQGSRMKSTKPKVLFKVLDKSMIRCVYDNLVDSGVENIIPIISPLRMSVLDALPENTKYTLQVESLGTGHAVMQASDLLQNEDGITIIVAGDQPLINSEELTNLIDYHIANDCDMTMMTSILDNPTGYGRVIKNGFQVQKIVEQKDLTGDQFNVTEVNISTYCFNNKLLFENINQISNDNNQNEYYITDLVEIFNKNKLKVGSVPISRNDFSVGVNDLKSLSEVNATMRNYINDLHMKNGVEILDPTNTYIGFDVEIGTDTSIYPGTVIMGKSKVGSNCQIINSYIYDSEIGDNVNVGPYAHLRNNAVIGDNCRIGNFVEIKNSNLDSEVKAAHLAYIGDSDIGYNTNVGCGVITANYDGKDKHRTKVGKNVFIGSNSTLIAPLELEDDVLVAAGSTISVDKVAEGSLVVARSREYIKENYKK